MTLETINVLRAVLADAVVTDGPQAAGIKNLVAERFGVSARARVGA